MPSKIIPRNDPEANVLVYKEMEKPLKHILKSFADRNTKRMMQTVTTILKDAGYDGTNKASVMIRKADPATIRSLEELAQKLPDGERQHFQSKLYGQIGTGSLTVRKAVNNAIKYGATADSKKLYDAGKQALRDTAKEGMLRGEFMVQKQVGIGWQMESPGLKEVDSFLKGRWTESDATQYLKPMSNVVKEQVEAGLFLGESPAKIAERMQKVEDINDVRANRNARTITTAVANDAQMEQYKKDGIQAYRYVATFDERTCPVCGDLDGQEFKITERSSSNYPPIHPNCRCTTVAVLTKKAQDNINRILEAHKDDKTMKVKPGTTFNEWSGKQVVQPKPKQEKPKTPTKRKETADKIKAREERYTADAEKKRIENAKDVSKLRKEEEDRLRKQSLDKFKTDGKISEETYNKAKEYLDTHQIDAKESPYNWYEFRNVVGADNYQSIQESYKDELEKWDTDHTVDFLRAGLVENKVQYNPVKMNEKELTSEEIISKIGGQDRTPGSCVSQAFAYIANESGLDVTDFRGGISQRSFAGGGWLNILQCGGCKMEKIGVRETKKLLATMEEGEEYFLITGRHCSIVRMGKNGPEYLELQDKIEQCGWQQFEGGPYGTATVTLERRFGCKRKSVGGMVKVKDLLGREDLLETVGYINTDPDKALRGAGGGIK